MGFRTILCATDFSPGADQALRLAVMLARPRDSKLILQHVWALPELAYAAGDFLIPPEVIQQVSDQAAAQLASAKFEARALGAGRLETRVSAGSAVEQIVGSASDDRTIDLVVVGTAGESGLKRVLLGSVAECIVRRAPCSVMVARARIEDRPFRSVLCAIDFSPCADDAAALAAEVAEPGGAGITLFHAVEPPPSYATDPLIADAMAELDRRAQRELEARADKLRKVARVPVTVRTAVGRPGAQILTAADSAVYDLVVVGSHGRGGLSRALLGSVAEKVVRHAWCPVLVARTRKE